MNLKTIDKPINILLLSISEIDDLIEEITYKKYFDTVRKKLETNTQYNNRIQWINNGFPTYKELSEITGSTAKYITDTSSNVNWTPIKEDLQLLYNRKEELERKEKQKEANKLHLEVWEHMENSIKFDLNYITHEKKRIMTEIKETNDDEYKLQLEMKLQSLSAWESDLGKDLETAQKNHRTALGQTNNYKDTTPDKIELEQSGELNLNQTIKSDETEEERLERYANYFKRINSKATSIPSKNNSG
ncbi:hypothetical protein [Methanobrevibacter sp.]|uniref:hypothetical protein n=1 Tax=Methanobrevibacter sp. TaxID=66852 RepID=UPI00388DC5A7